MNLRNWGVLGDRAEIGREKREGRRRGDERGVSGLERIEKETREGKATGGLAIQQKYFEQCKRERVG